MKKILSELESSGATGWLFGSIGSPTGKTKCCLIQTQDDLEKHLNNLPKNLIESDRYVIIDP